MAAVHGKNARVYANGYDLSSFLRQTSTAGECDTADASTFTMASKAKVAGLKSGKLNAEGLFAHAAIAPLDQIDDVMQAALGVEHVVWTYGPDGNAVGKRAVGLQAIETSYEIESPVDDVVSVKVEAETSKGNAAEGGVFLASGTKVATGNGTNVDNGAATLNGACAFLQALDVTGAAPSVTVKVQHSVDNSVWVDLVTFTAVTVDHKAEAIEVAGTVNRHLRATWTLSGTITDATFNVACARR